MTSSTSPITILLVDDDADDRDLAREAFAESHLRNDLHCVESGEEMLAYLRREGKYGDPAISPTPGIVLLDLNMPGIGGREALENLKRDPELRHIPVVVMTTSKADEDILNSYQHGANSYITKPVTFEGLVNVVKGLQRYWLQIVELPTDSANEK